jgi:predicted TIM-barrel fold metal-dependent hydrolase
VAGVPGVVDSHVHLLPDGLGRAVRAYFDTHHYDTSTFAYPLDHGEVCRRLAADGVSTVWSLPYARRPGSAAGLNASMAATVTALADAEVQVIGGATVHPGDEDPAGVVRAGVETLGLRVLKLHCSVGDFSADDPRLDPVWAYVSDIALPVVIHAGHPTSGHTDAADIAPLGVVAGRWPEVRLIVAHFGHPAGGAVLDLLEAHDQVHADLTPVVFDPVEVDLGRVAALSGRVLFGSDAPNTGFTAAQALAHLDPLGVGSPAWSDITGGTARRLQAEIRS